MSIAPVVATPSGGKNPDSMPSRDGLFDLIHSDARSLDARDKQQAADLADAASAGAAAVVQFLALQVSLDRGVQVGDAQMEKLLLPNLPLDAAKPIQTQAMEAVMPVPDSPPPTPHGQIPDSAAPLSTRADDISHAVRHGTLPVIVSGQLVELALLKERANATRRISMVLEGDDPGSVSVDARIEDGCLLISLNSAAPREPAVLDHYTREVQDLTRRLGWEFVETRLEILG